MWNLAILYRPRSMASVMAIAGEGDVSMSLVSSMLRGAVGISAVGVGVGAGAGVGAVDAGVVEEGGIRASSENWRAGGRLRRHCSSW